MGESSSEMATVRPRHRASNEVVKLLRDNPSYTMGDIRSIVGAHFPRRYATGPVFDYILDRVLNEYIRPQLDKKESTLLRQHEIQFHSKEVEKARIDELTGLPRRNLFTEILTIEKQRHKKWTFLLLDIDNFKRCNTVYGLEGGDRALQALTSLLKVTMNHETDALIGRWGGEEFIIAIPGEMNNLEARIAATREGYRQAIQTIFAKPDDMFQGTFSLGKYDHDFSTSDMSTTDVVNRADDALYMAKTSGKNNMVVWSSETPVRARKGML